ncbi:LysR family transcriptional regulator [Paenibacillus naphthalenovorans]|uniref:LysR family transcriptional regulator n=1 Tax=Paenibacillus naphthalenovorans TaxID=162209 RepID=UPI00088BE17C|nr:LysR family transcriptional regulator [Paenibacillus naphthalenovorans]SDI80586.1 DNA-binding transcriptional regulator, LysR family [Paenibacillus naphthalenovorans]
MDEKDFLLLKTLYTEKNISRTAEILYISQPAITYRIQNLEKYFNTPIISRGKKGVEFTAEGECLVKLADQILHEIRKTKEKIQNMGHQVQGTLRLGVSSNFARYRLPALLKRFVRLYPDVEIIVKTGWSTEVMNYLYKDEVHIGIVRGDHHWHEHHYFLYEEPVTIASKEPIHLEDLPTLARINYKTDSHLKQTIDHWWHKTFHHPPLITMDVDRIDTCVELVKNGLGYAIIPSISLSEIDSLHTIDLYSEENQPISRKTWMTHRHAALELSVVKAFVDFMKSQYNQEAPR